MKRFYNSLLRLLPVCLLLLVLFRCSQAPPAAETAAVAKVAASAKPAKVLVKEAAPCCPIEAPTAGVDAPLPESGMELPKRADLHWSEPVAETVFEEFRRWTESPMVAGANLQQGIQLAQQRRHALLNLIEQDPQRALELAVPHALRRQLPAEVLTLLERQVDASGDLMAMATTLDGNRGCQIDRKVTLRDGQVFDAYTYGRRGAIPTRDNIAIHGLALDDKLALSEFPGRVLDPSELTARVEAGQMLNQAPQSTNSPQPKDAADEVVIAFGDGRITRYADDAQAIAALLLAEGAEQSGATAALASDLDGVIAYSPETEGQKTLLIIRVDFPDFQGQSAPDSTLQTLISDMNSVYTDMSSQKASFALNGQGSEFTPTLRLPNNASYYNKFGRILDAARTAAVAAGYIYTDYTYEVVVSGSQPNMPGTAGVAWVGGRGAWLHNSQWNLKTCAHELGHNFGLPHSGAWDTDDGSVIGLGEAWDYGNVFDIMGVGPSPHSSRHFGASVKNYLDWIPDSDVVKITTNGTTTTRIRAMDKVQADGNQRALVVQRPGNSDDYWIEHRQLYGTNYGMRDGVLVNWANINGGYQQPLLLDMQPDTSEKTDAVLPIGMTFSDTAAGIHITPVGRGTDPDGVNWIDVTTTRGSVSGNLPPTASLSATNSNPAVSGSVTFTCTASDPNGDTLAYFWDWGNGTTTTTNSPTASKSWPAAGVYIVQCTVSDMKGLTTTADYVVQVGGASGTFFIEGVVSTIQGLPLQGIAVRVSPTQSANTDASGRYIITGLASGTYTLTASTGSTIQPDGFTNPVTVGPSLQDRNFTRPSYPLTWDANSGVTGAQDGSGNWANVSGNWRNETIGANNQNWNNASMDSATFGAGTDGSYAVTLSGTVQAGGGITFANSGYTLSGTAGVELQLDDGTNNSSISVAVGKSATINSAISYQRNKLADITVNSGAVLNLGGGATNSQYNFNGVGTVNMIAGDYNANVGKVAVATFNQSGGTFSITPGNNSGYNLSSNSRSVNYTLSGGTLTVNGNNTTSTVNNAYLGIGNGTAISNTSTMTVKDDATVNVGTEASRSGEIRISNTPASNGRLDVQGGSLTVGTGSTDNQIYFFKAGAFDAPYLASMAQSGGTVTANGIQFGSESGTYDTASSASLSLSGGSLYVGAQGIARGSAAGDLAVTIQLEGGMLGASQNWNSSLDMGLGIAGGGVTILAQDSAGTARNITLSGNLSDDGEVSGSLTKTGSGTLTLGGANTFTGGLIIQNGTVEAKTTNAALGAGTVAMGGVGSSGATLVTGKPLGNAVIVNAPDSGQIVIGANGIGSGFTLSGPVTLNGDLTLQTYDNTIDGTIKATANLTGGVTGTGNLLLNNLGLAANVINLTGNAVNHAGTITVQGTATGDTNIAAVIGANVTSVTQNSATSSLVLSGNNDYTGATTISAGTLRLGAANVIPDGTSKGNVSVAGTLDLNGFSETVNGLSGGGVVDNTAVSTNAVLTVNTSSNFNGTIQNTGAALALIKGTAGDLVLTGNNNTYSGGTTVQGGRLFIANGGALTPNGSVQVNAGTLTMNAGGSPTFAQTINLASGAALSMRQDATISAVALPTAGSVVFNRDDLATVAFSLNSAPVLTGDLTVQVGGQNLTVGDVTLTGVIAGAGGLTKSQTGTLILAGVNSYSGDTVVDGGVLAVNGTSIANTGKLVIAGGKVDLANTETVDTLFFGAVQQPAGDYTSADPSGNFTGAGILTVLSGPPGAGYASWATLNGASANLTEDHDNDGVKNGVEYFLGGLNGDTTGFTALPSVVSTAGVLSVSWTMGPGYSGSYGTDFVVEASAMLDGVWANEALGGTVGITGDVVTYTFPAGSANRRFVRLKVMSQ
jgi:autotransporter-associated beta strand protein